MINTWKLTLALCLATVSHSAASEEFDTWRAGLEAEAAAAGISPQTIQATLNHVELLPNVIKLDRAQPEFISTFLDYYAKRINEARIARGKELMFAYEPLLHDLEQQYGVPPAILIAFWGMETNYGGHKGNIDTFSTLATLALDGRRASFFRSQLLDAMRLADDGHFAVGSLRGSWAGAFGHMQFMPSTMLVYAMDGDGDGRIDLMNSIEDALTSAANYLSQAGWQRNEPAMLEVQLPPDFSWQDASLKIKRTVKQWRRLGVQLDVSDNVAEVAQSPISPEKIVATRIKQAPEIQLATSKPALSELVLSKEDLTNSQDINSRIIKAKWPQVEGQAAILLPQGWRGPAFMVFDNFDVIMDWNRSVNYALSVAQLAKELEGGPAIAGGLLAEGGGLTLAQMLELQTALNAQGFDAGTPDGFPGLQTQAALREYQLKQKLPADGYASLNMYQHVMQQTNNVKPVAVSPLEVMNTLEIAD
jgi:membrane-bound lytic murein transglycosylase B